VTSIVSIGIDGFAGLPRVSVPKIAWKEFWVFTTITSIRLYPKVVGVIGIIWVIILLYETFFISHDQPELKIISPGFDVNPVLVTILLNSGRVVTKSEDFNSKSKK
jgi:hypothetical protein